MSTDWAKLNAYVDGELDSSTAAEVASAIAGDPDLARKTAALHRLKAVTSGLSLVDNPPPLPNVVRLRAQWIWPARIAAAAILLIAITGIVMFDRLKPSSDIAIFESAFRAHEQWMTAGPMPQISMPALDAAFVANLSDANLKIVYAATTSEAGAAGARLLGFEGPHGCKLGLWIAPGHGGAQNGQLKLVPTRRGIAAETWETVDATYMLLAKGMEAERLDSYAKAISVIVIRGPYAQDQDKIALRAVTGSGTPCRA